MTCSDRCVPCPPGSIICLRGVPFGWSRVAAFRRELEELDAAVQRIEDGTYGVCARCGNLIGEARLDALPGARTCIGCAG